MKGLAKEFKEFIKRGNVIDMAVGVVIGAAFSAIVTSIVNDIIMPLISLITGGLDFSKWVIVLKQVEEGDPVTLNYGNLISVVINFLIVAFCIFLVVKAMNKLMKKKEEPKKEEPPIKPDDVVLLEEIRDLLKKQNKKEK